MQSCPCCKLLAAKPAPQRFAAARSGFGSAPGMCCANSEEISAAMSPVAATAAEPPLSESLGCVMASAPSCRRSSAAKAGVEMAVQSSPPSMSRGRPGLEAPRARNCTMRDAGTLTASKGRKADVPGGKRPLQQKTGMACCALSASASAPSCCCSSSLAAAVWAPSGPMLRTAAAARTGSCVAITRASKTSEFAGPVAEALSLCDRSSQPPFAPRWCAEITFVPSLISAPASRHMPSQMDALVGMPT
eukprot:scaffold10829_cov129-Isochrysis_galbana.AAC.3